MADLLTDDRAVSTTVSYVLGLAIAAALISGLAMAGGSLLDGQHDITVGEGMEVSGEQVATGYTDADRLAEATTDGNVRVRVPLPRRIAGESYRINVSSAGGGGERYESTVRLVSDGDVVREVGFRTHTPVAEGTAPSGDVVVRYTGDELELTTTDITGEEEE